VLAITLAAALAARGSPSGIADAQGDSSRFHFVDQPILAAIPSVNKSTVYEIVFRLNRALPRTKTGRIEAALSLSGANSTLAGFGPHRSSACYAAGSDGVARQSPRAAHRYPFTLTIERSAPIEIEGHAVLHRYFNFVSMLTGVSKRLHC
jgi:hypothetical protein